MTRQVNARNGRLGDRFAFLIRVAHRKRSGSERHAGQTREAMKDSKGAGS